VCVLLLLHVSLFPIILIITTTILLILTTTQ
jgi:hypothetical protein